MKNNILLIFAICFLLPLLSSLQALGQQQDSLRRKGDVFYSYPHKFAVRLVYQQRQLPFILQPIPGEGRAVYQSNSRRTFGVGGSLFDVSFTLSFMLPESLQRNSSYGGDNKQRDLRLNAFHKRWGLQLDRQNYTGYYLNNLHELDTDSQAGEEFPFYRQDLQVKRFGAGVFYLFQPDKFSYSAALNNKKKQHTSGGTFFLELYGGSLLVGGDSLLLPRRFFGNAGSAGRVEEVNVYHGSMMSGYAHTFVLGRFYLMGSLAIGPEIQRRNVLQENNQADVQWSAEGRMQIQAAVGYDDHTYFCNIAYNSELQQYEVNNLGVSVNTNGFRLLVGRRFDEFGFMTRFRKWGFYRKLRGQE
ncbi:hypothetical protein D770_19500 [Flammeovirgaceae bacterium 311]|nr:hypothetical protein D770_19500 [Flammeovirgaceae bacterium 311]